MKSTNQIVPINPKSRLKGISMMEIARVPESTFNVQVKKSNSMAFSEDDAVLSEANLSNDSD